MLSQTSRASHSLRAVRPLPQCSRRRMLQVRLASNATVTSKAPASPTTLVSENGTKRNSRPQKITRENAFSSPTRRPGATNDAGSLRKDRLVKTFPPLRTAVLRLWEPLQGIADAWTLRRALEKKYGSIIETHVLKDHEMTDRFTLLVYVIFADMQSLKRIPNGGETFMVSTSNVSAKPTHEIGLEDIESLAASESYEPGYEFGSSKFSDPGQRIIGGIIETAQFEYCENNSHRSLFQPTSRANMLAFLQWGGFTPLPSSHESATTTAKFTDGDLFADPNRAQTQHIRMRAALELCSQNVKLPTQTGATPLTSPSANVNPLAKLSRQGPAHRGRVFSGLHETVQPPLLGRLRNNNNVEKSDEEELIVALDTPPELSNPSDMKNQTSSSPEITTQTTPSPPPPIRPARTPEEQEELQRQMNAARILSSSLVSNRRKQRKPKALVTTSGNNHRREESRRDAESEFSDEPIETTAETQSQGVLSRLMGLFRR